MDLSRYADLFLTESREHLSAINHSLLELERSPEGREPLGAIFRAVHTVKGMSATMGYRQVAELAHEMETLLDHARRGELALIPPVLDLLFRAADALESSIESAVAGKSDDPDAADLVRRLQEASETAPAAAPSTRPLPAEGSEGGRPVRVRLAEGTQLRGVRAFLIVKRAESLGPVSSITPPLEALQAEEFDLEFAMRIDTAASAERIEQVLRAAGDVDRVDIAETGELAALTAGASAPASPADSSRARATRNVRIDLRRLDTLMNLIGELVIARGRLEQLAGTMTEPALDEAVAQASRLITELQDEIMLCRMVPVGQVFDRFPRLVRDAARELGKQIEFMVEGKTIELDRSMLDEIGDPIVHLLRNAIDHGIELPADRKAVGKSAIGRLTLSAARERSSVVIRVTDDGRGIDRARVLEKARQLGIIDDGRGELSDEELVRLISRPGFSTASKVTDISGRGVGIDVVHTRVRALGGSVEIRSFPGQGTTVTVRLPLTLAIVRALLTRVNGETYAVPMTHVSETVHLDASALRSVKGREVMVMREQVLPLVSFRDLVHLPRQTGARRQVIVLELGDRRAGLVVDELTGQQDIVVKQFDAVRESVSLFSGATILPDGAPALIVDVGSLL
jgi:two-component system chemotaxis sensor kinase CheA